MLRPYQKEAIAELIGAYRRGVRRALFVAPCGTGKTTTFVSLAEEFLKRGRGPALIVAHREELIQQAADRVAALLPGRRVEIEKGARVAGEGADVVVASVQTLSQHRREGDPAVPVRATWLKPWLVILDEAHHAVAPSWARVVARYCRPDGGTFVVGCTGTPKRLDKLSLHAHAGGIFEEVAHEYSIQKAMEDGFLCELRGYQVKTDLDLSAVKTVAGDFDASQLAKAIKKCPRRTEIAIDRWEEVAWGRRTIAFAVDIEHAQQIAEAFRNRSVQAESVDGMMRADERRAIIDRFRRGETTVLVNCQICTEGFDAPETACVLILRPTQSWALAVQMYGRGTRIHPSKPDGCVILDVVDITDHHSVVTLPSILDLPHTLDLEGNTLSAAAKMIDEAGSEAARLIGGEQLTFTELGSTLRRIDLFAHIEPPLAVRAASRFAWLAVPGGFSLGCGADGTVKREARLGCDAMGDFHLRLVESAPNEEGRIEASIRLEKALGSDEKRLFREADALVEWAWPNAAAVARHDVRWRNDPPTDPQRALLRKLGFTDGQMAMMTKGQASGAISQALAKRERRAA